MKVAVTVAVLAIVFSSEILAVEPSPHSLPPDQVDFFEKRIRPVLSTHCFECHDSREGNLKGGLALNLPLSLRIGGDSGPAIIAGDPEA
ncbi:MAG: c-type cytochrome domain-containing protein, partial [Verrucomicrobiota bacterium]